VKKFEINTVGSDDDDDDDGTGGWAGVGVCFSVTLEIFFFFFSLSRNATLKDFKMKKIGLDIVDLDEIW
jgi:hypothetical protein